MLRGFSVVNGLLYRCVVMLVGTLLFSMVAQAESSTQIARYLTASHQALPGQVNLLDQTFQVRFPHTVRRIGDAR